MQWYSLKGVVTWITSFSCRVLPLNSANYHKKHSFIGSSWVSSQLGLFLVAAVFLDFLRVGGTLADSRTTVTSTWSQHKHGNNGGYPRIHSSCWSGSRLQRRQHEQSHNHIPPPDLPRHLQLFQRPVRALTSHLRDTGPVSYLPTQRWVTKGLLIKFQSSARKGKQAASTPIPTDSPLSINMTICVCLSLDLHDWDLGAAGKHSLFRGLDKTQVHALVGPYPAAAGKAAYKSSSSAFYATI